MTVRYAAYDVASGEITRIGTCREDDLALQGTIIAPVGDFVRDSTHYVSAGVVTPKTASAAIIDKTTIVADGVDTATISGLPNPSLLDVNGSEVTVTDGTLELTTSLPGSYVIRLRNPAHFEMKWKVTAT